ncbi:MAG: hypothetical protein RLZZ370_605 [Bacteroidota bacterium]|jgi:AraC-like DNA-binding protein
MNEIIHLKTISDLYKFLHLGYAEHPLWGVVDFSMVKGHSEELRIKTDFYSVMFKNHCRNHIRYGRNRLDFQDGSLVCIAPNHVISMEIDNGEQEEMMGWGLFFHPDLIRGSSLGNKMREYSFFNYEISEALHLSEKEQQVLYDCIQKIRAELTQNIDSFSQAITIANIELLLQYAARFYGRQFITRKSANRHVVSRVEQFLKAYFESNDHRNDGIPTVKELAGQVHLSPSYLSDLLKKETGLNAQDHIHYFVIEQAKHILIETNQSVSEIAYSLGFEYPQYFSRLFKLKTGKTPMEFRSGNEKIS